jgi:PEP-CTERM motif
MRKMHAWLWSKGPSTSFGFFGFPLPHSGKTLRTPISYLQRFECIPFGGPRAPVLTLLICLQEATLRKALLFLAPLVFFVFASSAFADGVDYTVTTSVMGTPVAFAFSEPSTISSLDTTTDVTVEGALFPSSEVIFYSTAQAGLFDVIFDIGTDSYDFAFFGPQIYSGNGPFTLLTGTFPISSGLLYVDGLQVADLSGGSVTATPTAAPEPATFALLGSGLFAVGFFRRKLRLA